MWAKSLDESGRWLPLWQHLADSSDVAEKLLMGWLAPSVVRLLAADFGGDVEQARAAVRFLAGMHDLGKATPAFAVQCTVLAQRMCDQGLYLPLSRAALPDRSSAHHSVAGQHMLVRWLIYRGWSLRVARTWGVVLGGHHGVPPDSDAERSANPDELPYLYGEGSWDRVRDEFVEWMVHRTGVDSYLPAWSQLALSQRFQVLATAVVIVSDWIASNSDLFPFHDGRLPELVESPARVQHALQVLRLPQPWRPQPVDLESQFLTRFGLPPGAAVRPVQAAACAAAGEMPEPGLLIIEAAMGEGKTEAALAAAEIAAARSGAGGVLVALPTQATTDAMFARVVAWLDAMRVDDQQVGGSIVLGHGRARFNRLFEGLLRAGRLAEVGRDTREARHAVVAHGWLSGRNKALLANFAVVTIDQLLFAGLKARHLMLRHLALAGKVVVIDEIHAYDVYMSSYLLKVLTWLGAYRVPVVALSATLPAAQRRALVQAYRAGRWPDTETDLDGLDGDIGYPVLTWAESTTVSSRVAAPSGRSTQVRVSVIEHGLDDAGELVALLREKLVGGGTALVVRNTVRRVLETADRLEEAFPGGVTVAHARFTAADRMRNDANLLDRFGPPGKAQRPDRHIVVASQLVEQSLDVDFDLLITDLAPIDLVLQRIGRLHRHQRGPAEADRPAQLRAAEVYITGADFTQDPPVLEPGAERYVYDTHTLLRAAGLLQETAERGIDLPDDIAPLVQRGYGDDPVGPPSWQDALRDARARRDARAAAREAKAETFQVSGPGKPGKAISGWVSASVGEADESSEGRGQVRDGAPSLEVLLVVEDDTGRWTTPSWLEDRAARVPIPTAETPPDHVAEVVASCVLRLPLTFSNADAEEELWKKTPPAWEESPLIYRYPVLVVDPGGWGEITGRRVRYTPERGLEVFDDAD
ncbi:CRISPR-associated helicase Cas3' [Amycolatopsis sp. DG1A-15b]|uniref:CRISPR-associated helicase Cas3' n=1 Tax=Amycolatopsis sp. DG1A-15b TaxID=3052846 RepID=UPI00255B7652|nr:CRISPR-associated helicase Cas3' [Amycolatopsis sp. DG1A-15b]WIX85675.1 CRISPR-associated helicase Cas3' [Amycolatopsis sp. DG1A-15b]